MTNKLMTESPLRGEASAPLDLLQSANGVCPRGSPPCQSSVRETLARFDHEAERGVFDTGRYRCSYYVWGKGPPLLFVPGMGDNSRSFVFLASQLAGQFRCIAYDYPTGCGDGARLWRYTHTDLVADLFAVLDHLLVERCYVFGSSFGSTVTLAALRQEPARLPRAILQGGFARRPLSPAERLTARLGRVWPGRLARFPFYQRLFRYNHAAGFAAQPPERWHYCLSRIGQRRTRVLAQYALLLHRVDVRPLLPDIRQPLLLVTGDCDPLVKQPCTDELLHGLPNAAHVEVNGCGHLPLFSHPDELAQIVSAYLTPPQQEQ